MACFFFEGTRTARASRPYHKKNNFAPPGRGRWPQRTDCLFLQRNTDWGNYLTEAPRARRTADEISAISVSW
jgi:hypothetical protein